MNNLLSLCISIFVIILLFLGSCSKKDDHCSNLVIAEVRPATELPTDTLPCDYTLFINTNRYYAVNLPDSLKIWNGVDFYQILVKYRKLNEMYYCNSGSSSLQFEKIELDCIETF